ncbi:CD2 antigen cytoplasmic tail-binding protein 2 homolog isoform X1 [Zingiber officinale]|uniref:CD2 antigen cytoplasmic tail-binding protein 2 homolog isoform X1 n=1 Tax=Zingiber officinale TaxID=94328 RepID=UPI001C4CB5B7|nr:CD2 antigen cytoplasmic tail-binding protein 2 homolog isoform X1 [Zingiber officinale]
MAERGKKRPLPLEEFDPTKAPAQRQARFPKGKKAKRVAADRILDGNGGDESWMAPDLASKKRAKLRNKMREDAVLGDQVDGFSGEVQYEDNTNFEDDGIQIEPFNLKEEREEGYFDDNGNFVEYAKQNEIKDAWLDSFEVDAKLAGKFKPKESAEEAYDDLSSDDFGKIKRRIANALQPGETIIQALKRLKGSSTDKKAKMLETTKQIFDQLTEDAMKLMENGEYNVYYEDQETFVREAEGYERIVCAKEDRSNNTKHSEPTGGEDIFSDNVQSGEHVSSIWDIHPGTSSVTDSVQQASPGDDKFDMFGDDDDTTNVNPPVRSAVSSSSDFLQDNQPTSATFGFSQDLDSGDVNCGGIENDYVYDESSGYYYSSSLGYYYDPTSGMYCSATTGTWYTYDEQSGTYTEIQSSTTGAEDSHP